MHFRILVGVVLFAFVVECIISYILINTGVVTTSASQYVLKSIVVPSGINLLCAIVGSLVVKSKRFSQNQKIYTVSLLFVIIDTVLFIAHNQFPITFVFFIFAVLLTKIYLNHILTAVTAAASFVFLIISELIIVWDVGNFSAYENSYRLGDFLIALFILIAVLIINLVEIHYFRKKHDVSIQKELERQLLKQKLQVDELTGVFNRKALQDAMSEIEFDKSQDQFIFAIADIDHFKKINDYYGHHVGDSYLVAFAQILKNASRGVDVFRYGGDEFCFLFKDMSIDKAVAICQNIQEEVKSVHIENYPNLKHTVSFGLATYDKSLTPTQLFMNADQALYTAKETRNAIQVF